MEYANQRIKFTNDEVRAMQKATMDNSYGFKLLAFRDMSELEWSYFVRSSHFIYPEEKMVIGSRQLFAALLKKCLEKTVVPICAYKPRETGMD